MMRTMMNDDVDDQLDQLEKKLFPQIFPPERQQIQEW